MLVKPTISIFSDAPEAIDALAEAQLREVAIGDWV